MTATLQTQAHSEALAKVASMPRQIQPNAELPDVVYYTNRQDPTNTHISLQGRKVVLVFVPGADTPTCTNTHLKGYQENIAAIQKKGFEIVFVSNDKVDTMMKWCPDGIQHIADLGGDLINKTGLGMANPRLGFCAKRAVLVVQNLQILNVFVDEDAKEVKNTSADNVYKHLLDPTQELA